MSLNPKEFSIVEWCGLSAHKCGYCSEASKKADSSISHGMVAHTMTVNTYQELIDRGWRRSGTYCYKPVMDKTCCAQYTIRNNALNFKISKSQKKVIKKFNKFLSDGEQTSKSYTDINSESTGGDQHMLVNITDKNIDFDMGKCIDPLCDEESKNVPYQDLHSGKECLGQSESSTHCRINEQKASTSENSRKASTKCAGADPNKPSCKKAKLLRLERKHQKMIAHGHTANKMKKPTSNEPKSLDELINEVKENANHRLQIKTICSNSLNKSQLDEEYEVYFKYQTIIHNDPPKKCNLTDFKRFLVNTPLQVCIIEL